jgi:ferredoxin
MTMYRIEIDRSICSGFGACAELAPHLFEVAGDGIATLRLGETGDPAAVEAADECPMGAISVIEIAEKAA